METRLHPETPQPVRDQLLILFDAIDAQCLLMSTLELHSQAETDCSICIDVLYLDANAILREWEIEAEAQVRKLAQPQACSALCAEFNIACDGSWACTDARRAELRKAA